MRITRRIKLGFRHVIGVIGVAVVFLFPAGCACRKLLTVEISETLRYASPDGPLSAQYGSLSDGSLYFVKVTMPDGREYTLPQNVSASGVRYTDGHELVWWEHQGTVLVETLDAEGNWRIKYRELRAISSD